MPNASILLYLLTLILVFPFTASPAALCEELQHHDFRDPTIAEKPLGAEAYYGHLACVRNLLRNEINPNTGNSTGATPLFLASCFGRSDCVNELLRAGAHVDAADYGGRTPLHAAAFYGHVKCLQLLICAGAVVNRINTEQGGPTPLHYAATNGHRACVQELLAAHADQHIRTFFCRYYLDHKTTARPNETPRDAAKRREHYDIVNILDKHEFEYKAYIDHLMKEGIVNERSLLEEVYRGHHLCVEKLLKNGTDPNLHNSNNVTPLLLASSRGHTKCVAELLKAGADVDINHNDGRTPLHAAAVNGHLDCLHLLIDAGANINTSNIQEGGLTPLHLAASNGHLECVEELVATGAHTEQRIITGQYKGKTPAGAAELNGYQNISRFLQEQKKTSLVDHCLAQPEQKRKEKHSKKYLEKKEESGEENNETASHNTDFYDKMLKRLALMNLDPNQ
ncbi:ankyrin repeat domain-containing protein [bacterium]|nr:MAG: ankyrin repeat domain-containing protein [bacterium]